MEAEARIQHIFFSMNHHAPQSARYQFGDASASASFMLSALAEFRLLPVQPGRRRFHLFVTNDTTEAAVTVLAGELADALGLDAAALAQEIWSNRMVIPLTDVATEARSIIPRMLEQVRDGDALFLEPTQGPRPIQMAMTVGTALVSSLMRIETAPLYYASTVKDAENGIFAIEEIKDILAGLNQTMAVRDLLHHLRPETLDPATGGKLSSIRQSLDSSDTRALQASLQAPGFGTTPGQAVVDWALRRFQGYFPPPTSSATTSSAHDHNAFLDLELALVERLRVAGRHADALRVLREHVVNLATLALLPTRQLDGFSVGFREGFEHIALRGKAMSGVAAPCFFRLLAEQRNRSTHGAFKAKQPIKAATLEAALHEMGSGHASETILSQAATNALAFLRDEVLGNRGATWLTSEQTSAFLVLLPSLLTAERPALMAQWQSLPTVPPEGGVILFQHSGAWKFCQFDGPPPTDAAGAASLVLTAGTGGHAGFTKPRKWEKPDAARTFASWILVDERVKAAPPESVHHFPWTILALQSAAGGTAVMQQRDAASASTPSP